MAYIDKILWYDQDNRYIPTENKKEGWDWDFQKLSIRYRASEKDGSLVSIEAWGDNGNCQEIMLTRQNAMRLADTLKMAVVEFTVEEMMESDSRRIEELSNKLDWLEPVIQKEIEKWKKRKGERKK